MKKCILSAVCVIALSGYAAAQSTPAKASSAAKQKEVKKESVVKKETVKKDPAKTETAVLKLPAVLPPADTTSIPKVKNEQ